MMPFCAGTQARTRLFCSNGRHNCLLPSLDEGAAHASVCQGRRYGFHGIRKRSPIGTMELCDIDPVQKTGRICRVLFAEEARGKGLAHRALSALCEKVFAETELERLSLRVYCFNLPAIRCYERLGFLVTEYFEEADSHWNNYAMERKKISRFFCIKNYLCFVFFCKLFLY